MMLAPSAIDRDVYIFPTSYAQQRLWFLDQLVPGNAFYNIATAIPLRFALNVSALERSLNEIVRRHETLRTTFAQSEGQPVQVVSDQQVLPLPVIDLRDLPSRDRRERARTIATEESQQPFDLTRGPLLRTSLVRLDDQDYLFLLTMHHIVSDGWSMGVFFHELRALYAAFSMGRPSPLAELPVQYADYASWQREWLQGDVVAVQLAYWKNQLREIPMLRMPTDRPRPAVQTFRGARLSRTLSAATSQQLNAFGREEGVTLFMTLLAAIKALLFRYTGQDDVVVGCPIAGRTRAELEGLIGFFVNTLVMRTSLSGDPTLRQLLQRVRETALGAYAHQDLPFDMLVEALHPERNLGHNPLFQVGFVLQNAWTPDPGAAQPVQPALEIERGTAIFDLAVHCAEGPTGVAVQVEYSTDLFEPDTIKRLMDHFERLLIEGLTNPDQPVSSLPLLSAAEREQLLYGWNATTRDFNRTLCFHEHFEAQVAQRPSAIALVTSDETLTYAELNRRANRLAWRLRAFGVRPDALVGLCVERSAALMIGLLGIMKAGGAYVALDPSYPSGHLRFMVEDAGTNILVTQSHLVESTGTSAQVFCLDVEDLTAERDDNPPHVSTSSNLAYVIYTSGSTGKPKGVLIEHRGLINVMSEHVRLLGLNAESQVLQFASLSFDASIFEIAMAFSGGGTLHIASREELLPGPALLALMRERAISIVTMPPSVMAALSPTDLPALTTVTVAGEACPADVVARWAPGRQFFNLYGPTETTILASLARCVDGHRSPPIGRAIANAQLYVLDPHLEPVPIGVAGELYIGGTGVGRGYLNRPELTRERFLPDPFSQQPHARMYKTGDLVRYLSDGQIEFIGRLDHQIKLRGYRIELGEIEAVLRQHPAVLDAAATVHDDARSGKRIVGHVVRDPSYASTDGFDRSLGAEQIERWRTIYDDAYGHAVPSLDPRFSISGWNSSYTGAPIPDVEMREWLDDTVAAVLELTPRRVLEIGCGTGLVLFALAARCEHYCATDFSAAGLNHVSQHLTPDEASRVRLLQRPADDFADLGPGAYDVVILNSVVQYFPSIEYLMRVLEGAASVLAPGGSIFLGDVRSLPLLEAFHVSVEAHRAASSMSTDQLRQRVRRRMLQEQELVVDPAFFEALPKWIPSIRSADIRRKRGRSENELTRFRYDVVLHTATHPGRSDRRWVTWAADDVASTTIPELIESRTAIGLRNVPDRLLAPSIRMRNLLAGTRAPATVGDLRHAVGLAPMATQTVDDLCRTAAELGCNVHLAYSTDRASECVDVLLTPPGVEARANEWEPARGAVKAESLHQYANNPLHGIAAQRLVPELREFLKTRLPDYMVPAAFVLLDTMPLTPSGKIDRRALPPPDTTRPDLDEAYVSPRNAVEDALADIWRQVLGVEEVGVRDNFFDIGGDSILSIQIVSRANQSGLRMSPQDVFQHQTIAELAAVARPAGFVASEQHVIVGSVPLTPIQRWFLDKDPVDPHFFNQAVLLSLEQGSNAPLISRALSAVFTHHDALRLLFIRDEHGWTERHVEHDAAVQIVRLNTASLTAEDERATIERTAAELNASFDLATGPLVCAALFDAGLARRGHLLIVAHHLVIDGVSWRILLEDVQQASAQLSRGEPIRLPAKTTSFKTWAERLVEYAQSSTVASEMPYWLGIITAPRVPLPRDIDHPGFGSDQSTRTCVVTLTVNQTRALLRDVPAAYHTQMNDVLVTALAQAFARWTGEEHLLLSLEGHGREPIADDVDTSRTVGWFTSQFPVRITVGASADAGADLVAVKETLRSVPAHGIGYGLLRYLRADSAEALGRHPDPEVMFNYLGQFGGDEALAGSEQGECPGPLRSPNGERRYLLEINASILSGRLRSSWTFSERIHRADTIEQIANDFLDCLQTLIAHCTSPGTGRYTPSDFSKARVTQKDLDRLLSRLDRA